MSIAGGVMDARIDRAEFQEIFKGRAIVLTDLPDGRSRSIAAQVNEAVGRGDATLYTKAEYRALFDALRAEDGAGDTLTLLNSSGESTATGLTVQEFLDVSIRAADFFDEAMYVAEVTGWPADHLLPDDPFDAPPGARLRVWRTDPLNPRHIPEPGPSGVLFTSGTFSLMNSGNRTKYVPKRSWKVNLDVGDDDDRVAGMSRLNLKAMYNDPSQMREAVAWHMFGVAGLPSPRHTFAKFALNSVYRGLFSVVEEVDRRFLKEHFGANDRGNLYKAYCGDLGCATLEDRDPGRDAGTAYRSRDPDDATYRLKTNEDDPAANTYDDLAEFIGRVNGARVSGGADMTGDTFRASIEDVFDVRAFLRWASVNILLGSWDNYFATPANYYLYNSGRGGSEKDFVARPYFTFIPWDYDNCLGIDYFGSSWQYTDLLDWPSATRPYWAKQGRPKTLSRIPLVTNLLANQDFVRYYLDHLEYLLDTHFNPQSVTALVGTPIPGGALEGVGLWQRVKQAAYLESDTPFGGPFTGRQFSNDEVYRSAFLQNELRKGEMVVIGIYHYTLMRYDRARAQLASLRVEHPSGSSGAAFPAVPAPLPQGT